MAKKAAYLVYFSANKGIKAILISKNLFLVSAILLLPTCYAMHSARGVNGITRQHKTRNTASNTNYKNTSLQLAEGYHLPNHSTENRKTLTARLASLFGCASNNSIE